MADRCLQGLDGLPEAARRCVLTIGNFDGVHLGHQRIVAVARELSAGAKVVAMTFDPPPDLVLRPADAPLRVAPQSVKCRLLLEAGCDYVVTVPASRELLSLTPAEFVQQVIVDAFAPRHMVEGPNFFFGRRREGDVVTLRQAGAAAGFDVRVVEPVELELHDGRRLVSSTLIRSLVTAGRIADAAACLGRPFTLYGRVVRGRGVGRQLEYPTANLALGDQVVPADGVYAGRAEVGGASFAAAISVGTAPTFNPAGASERTVEAFLLSAGGDLGDLYDQPLALSFTRRLREQRRYESPEALKAQMALDVEQVRALCP